MKKKLLPLFKGIGLDLLEFNLEEAPHGPLLSEGRSEHLSDLANLLFPEVVPARGHQVDLTDYFKTALIGPAPWVVFPILFTLAQSGLINVPSEYQGTAVDLLVRTPPLRSMSSNVARLRVGSGRGQLLL